MLLLTLKDVNVSFPRPHRRLSGEKELHASTLTVTAEVRTYLWGDDAAADDQDIRPVELPQLLEELGDQRLVPGGERADPDAVHVCIDRLLGHLQRRLLTREPHVE